MASAVTKSTCTGVERPVYWQDSKLVMIDQRNLPGAFTLFSVETVDGTIKAIKDMAVRGAPAIGAAGAFGLVLAANASSAGTPCVNLGFAAGSSRVLRRTRRENLNFALMLRAHVKYFVMQSRTYC